MGRVYKYIIMLGIISLGFSFVSLKYVASQDSNTMGDSDESPFIKESTESSITDPRLQQALAEVGLTEIPNFSGESSTYTLGISDVIEIQVIRHPEVSGQFAINSEGKIQYDFVGDVKIEGMVKDEVKEVLTDLLSTYIINPEVTVKIVGYNSKIVYVVGEVGRPGKIFMRGDTITVREALMQAGLPTLSAATKKSRLFTPSEKGKPDAKKVNVYALLYEGNLKENQKMAPGDTLYVPPTFLTKTMRVINPVAQPIGTAASTGRTVTTGF